MEARAALTKAEEAYEIALTQKEPILQAKKEELQRENAGISWLGLYKDAQIDYNEMLKLAAQTVQNAQNTLNELLYMNYVIKPSVAIEFIENKTHKTLDQKDQKEIFSDDEQDKDELIEISFTTYTPAQKTKKSDTPKAVQWILPNKENSNAKTKHTARFRTEDIESSDEDEPSDEDIQSRIEKRHEKRQKKKEDKYWSYVKEDIERDKVHMAEEALKKLTFIKKLKP